MNGKGDRPRPVHRQVFMANFDAIFGKCSRHPNYTPGTFSPKCDACRRIWREAKLKKDE